jgi:predicted nucleic acid-binding protein
VALLFDTSAVIGLVERHSAALRDIVARNSVAVAISTMTLGELERGVRSRPTPLTQHTLDVASGTMRHVPIDDLVGPACFGHIASTVSRRVGRIDCWIAATAVINRHELVTQDRRLASELNDVDWSLTAWNAPDIIYVPVDDDTDLEAP